MVTGTFWIQDPICKRQELVTSITCMCHLEWNDIIYCIQSIKSIQQQSVARSNGDSKICPLLSQYTASYGIWFRQGENRLHRTVVIPEELCGDELLMFTDANWGPQDASKPKANETRTVTLNELRSIQGFYITCMGLSCIFPGNSPGIPRIFPGNKDLAGNRLPGE